MTTRVAITVMTIIAVSALITTASAEVPQVINYQGRLTDDQGEPVADGDYLIKFTIYGSESGDDDVWSSDYRQISVVGGLFAYALGNTVALPGDLFEIDTARYLGIKVGVNDEIVPRTKLTSVAYAYHALRADTAAHAISVADNSVNSAKIEDGTIEFVDVAQNGADPGQTMMWNGASWLASDVSMSPTDNSVSQIKLKTSTGEVYTSSYAYNQIFTLPGGEYGFYPQIRGSSSVSGRHSANILGTSGMDGQNLPTSWTTTISLRAEGTTIYARQRYITSSGKDHWIFLLCDKSTGQIVSGYQAPDHPCYGSGGNETDIPHPFGDYDEEDLEVILIDNAILSELRLGVSSRRTLATVIDEEYEVDYDSQPTYTPREIIELDEYGDKDGEILARIPTPFWTKFLVQTDEIFLKRRMVKSLPEGVSYKSLKRKSRDVLLSQPLAQSGPLTPSSGGAY